MRDLVPTTFTRSDDGFSVCLEQKIQFHWDEYEQNLILSSYFWTHCILQFPGGMLAHYYGTKHTLGFNNLLIALLTLFIPMAASFGLRTLFILRAIQGLIAVGFVNSLTNDETRVQQN